MGSPYTTTSVSNYNSNPPSDDGSQTSTNRVQWATHINKIGNPIKTAFDTSESNTQTAFGKIVGGAGITSTSTDYTISSGDQGKFVEATSSGIVITTPDATSVGSPFVCFVVNSSAGDIALTGSDPGTQQTVDGATSVTIPAGCGVILNTDGSNWITGGQNFSKTQIAPQGRLTLVSGTPVLTSEQTGKTAVYYTPFVGDLIPIPNGTVFSIKEFAELTLTLNGTNYTANSLLDVFVALNPSDNSTVIIGSGPAWSSATSRGTGAGTTEIARLKGLFVNNNAITLRNNTTTYSVALKCAIYVGTIYIDGTAGQVSCHASFGQNRKWGVWNAYGREPIRLVCGDSTGNWQCTSSTPRASNNTPSSYALSSFNLGSGTACNGASVLCGLPEEAVTVTFQQDANCSTGSGSDGQFYGGVGWNSITAFSGKPGSVGYNGASTSALVINTAVGKYSSLPFTGIAIAACCESLPQGVAATVYGTQTNMQMTVEYRG